MLGAALSSKSLRSELRPDDFSEKVAQDAIREMQAGDENSESDKSNQPTKVTLLMKSLGIEVGDQPASTALLNAVKHDGRRRRMKSVAAAIQNSVLTNDEQINDYLQRIAQV